MSAAAALTVALVIAARPAWAQNDMRECDLTVTGQLPLPDAGGMFYRRVGLVPEYAATSGGPEWRQVGLYGQGRTTRPAAHEQAGLLLAQQIAPINGKVVMLSIGMSNTRQEFGRFEARAEADPAVHPDLVIFNAAQGGQPADAWADPQAQTWLNVHAQLAQNGYGSDQVQVAWIKHAVRSPLFPPLDFPGHPEGLTDILEQVVTSLRANFPNVVVTYMSSRTRAYNTNQAAQSPEPAAYEGGFAAQWLIERQLNGDPDLRYDGVAPPAPWLSWGPYLWTDGTGAPEGSPPSYFDARSDGAIWTCADVQSDGVHPSPPTPDAAPPEGEFKVGDQIFAFFVTDLTTTPWFLASTTGGPTLTSLTANGMDMLGAGVLNGSAPFTVNLAATASGSVAGMSWTYDDGTFSYTDAGNSSGTPYFDDNAAPTKIFHVPGTYDVRLAVRGTAGDTTLASFQVVVDGDDPPAMGGIIDFDDGTAGQPIGAFYGSQGVLFSNAQWLDALAPPLDGVNDHIGSTLPNGVAPESTAHARVTQIDEASAVVVQFLAEVNLVTIRAMDVGAAGVQMKAYDAFSGGALVGSDIAFGNAQGTGNFVDLTVVADGIRRVELFQPNSGNPDQTFFDCLRFSAFGVLTPDVGGPPRGPIIRHR